MLDGMGAPVTRNKLESIGIYYDFEKKTFSFYLYYAKNSKSKNIAEYAEKNSTSKKKNEEKIRVTI